MNCFVFLAWLWGGFQGHVAAEVAGGESTAARAQAAPISAVTNNAVATNLITTPSTNAPPTSKFIDPQDGWLDVSGFLDTTYGFVPVVIPITQPAVGYGAGGGLAFINRNEPTSDGKPQRPDLMAVGGLGTDNGTWGVFGGWSGSWLDGKLQTLVAGGYASVNLDFYGVGDGPLNSQPAAYNVEGVGGIIEARYRIIRQPLYAGLRYTYAHSDVSFDSGFVPPGVNPADLAANLSGLSPLLIYDSRNNIFTPTKGLYLEVEAGLFSQTLGSDYDFQLPSLTGVWYTPLSKSWTLGVKAEGNFSFGNVPFYLAPGISLRGVEARRYLGQDAADLELELRWQFTRRFSVLAFGGVGAAWINLDRFQNQQTVAAGGFGFRYLLARKYGLHLGFDVGFGPDEPIFYIQFGSAWFRP